MIQHHKNMMVDAMEINEYFDEFFNQEYMRDFRSINGDKTRVCHAPKREITTKKHKQYAKRWVTRHLNKNNSKYYQLISAIAYYRNVRYYQLGIVEKKMFNHLLYDFDSENAKYKLLKDKLRNTNSTQIKNKIHKQIQELILSENLLEQPFNEMLKVYEYYANKGWKPYVVFSGSKGFHLRLFFEPINMKYFDRFVHDYTHKMIDSFNLETLDLACCGEVEKRDEHGNVVDKNPMVTNGQSKRMERIPYSFNEKSGWKVTPILDPQESTLDEIIDEVQRLSSQKKLQKVDDFSLSDYTNTNANMLMVEKHFEKIVESELKMKQRVVNERKLQKIAKGEYINEQTPLFKDLRILVRFVCGTSNLASEHELYDGYRCVFHDDKHPSAYVTKKNYHCLSGNCSVDKLRYFDFIRKWFKLKTEQQVKDKMVELQNEYDKQHERIIKVGDMEIGVV